MKTRKLHLETQAPAAALSPNARVHWSKRHAAASDARVSARLLTCQAMGYPRPTGIRRLSAAVAWKLGKGAKPWDKDNAVAGLKALQDGICDALRVDDECWDSTTVQFVRLPNGDSVSRLKWTVTMEMEDEDNDVSVPQV